MKEKYKNKIKWALFTIFILFVIVIFIIALSNLPSDNTEDFPILTTSTDLTFKCPKEYENKELEEQGMIKFKDNYFKNNTNASNEDFEKYKKYMMDSNNCFDEIKTEVKTEIDKIENIDNNLIKSETKQESKTISEIVNEWKPRASFIYCAWRNPVTKELTRGLGSGTLNYFNNTGFNIMTNKHVLFNDGLNPLFCNVLFPFDKDFEVNFSSNNIIGGNDEDWGYIKLPDNDPFLSKFNKKGVNLCNLDSVEIGDEIIILGFPTIGSNYGVTATNGIISGVEPNYFITSAKIDHGNSGGTAILLKDDCYLGIPSSAMLGEMESMGRILKWNFFIK